MGAERAVIVAINPTDASLYVTTVSHGGAVETPAELLATYQYGYGTVSVGYGGGKYLVVAGALKVGGETHTFVLDEAGKPTGTQSVLPLCDARSFAFRGGSFVYGCDHSVFTLDPTSGASDLLLQFGTSTTFADSYPPWVACRGDECAVAGATQFSGFPQAPAGTVFLQRFDSAGVGAPPIELGFRDANAARVALSTAGDGYIAVTRSFLSPPGQGADDEHLHGYLITGDQVQPLDNLVSQTDVRGQWLSTNGQSVALAWLRLSDTPFVMGLSLSGQIQAEPTELAPLRAARVRVFPTPAGSYLTAYDQAGQVKLRSVSFGDVVQPPVDGGTGGGAGASGTGGAKANGTPASGSSGCGCEVPRQTPSERGAELCLLLGAVYFVRRRRRS